MSYSHVLLASFVSPSDLDEAFEKISTVANVPKHRIFVFRSTDLEDYILTFNVNTQDSKIRFTDIWADTISVHRKKETNTLFSLNALNELIKLENDDVLVKNFKIDWERYRNCFLLFRNGSLAILPLELIKLNR
jgi:hypothetical protein